MKNQNKQRQNAISIDEKLKTKSLMFFASFFSFDLQDFKFTAQYHGGLRSRELGQGFQILICEPLSI